MKIALDFDDIITLDRYFWGQFKHSVDILQNAQIYLMESI